MGNFDAVLSAVRPIFLTYELPFKYAANHESLWRLNAGLAGYSQIGKSIVAYICDETVIHPLMKDLVEALSFFRNSAMLPPFATPIGGELPLSFRYGAFVGESVTLNGECSIDQRSKRQNLDELPPCPFLPFMQANVPDQALNRLLMAYPVFSVLGQAGKGGVFAALDIDSPTYREVIIKLGRRNGNTLPDGRDGMDLIKHEHWFYSLLQGGDLCRHIPELVHFAECDTAAALVLSRIDGTSLLGHAIDGSLDRRHIDEALSILDEFHKAGYLVGDAKLANFIAPPREGIKAIDFESAGPVIGAGERSRYASFLFTDDHLLAHPTICEKLHFLYSVIDFDRSTYHEQKKGNNRVICLEAELSAYTDLSPIANHAQGTANEIMKSIA